MEALRQEGAWYGWCLVNQQMRPETSGSFEGQARGWAFMLSAVRSHKGLFYIYIYIYIHLFVWLRRVLAEACRIFALRCRMWDLVL